MGLGEHAGFIITGYLLSFAVIVALVLWSLRQSRRTHARIEELEARGIRRRSDKSGDSAVADQGSKA